MLGGCLSRGYGSVTIKPQSVDKRGREYLDFVVPDGREDDFPGLCAGNHPEEHIPGRIFGVQQVSVRTETACCIAVQCHLRCRNLALPACLLTSPIAPAQIDAYGTVAHLAKAAMTGVKLARLPTTIEDVRSRCRSLKHAIDMIDDEIKSHDRCRAGVSTSGQISTISWPPTPS